jgi:hypothetical protein
MPELTECTFASSVLKVKSQVGVFPKVAFALLRWNGDWPSRVSVHRATL